MAVLVKDIIPNLITYKTDWRIALIAQWQSVVGKLATRIRLEKVYDTTLVIGVYESQWIQELYLFSSLIIDSINTFIGEKQIEHVRFTLVEEKKKVARPKKKGMFKKAATAVLTQDQEKALATIHDEELKKALADFWRRCTGAFHE